jgi:hypothetical protein
MALVEPAPTARDGSGSAIVGAAPLHQTVPPWWRGPRVQRGKPVDIDD